jgi:NADH dehydrogenase
MTVFVTGGTGFVGRAILRELAARGHRARLLARDPDAARARTASLPGEREFCQGDVLEASLLSAALAGADAVIHLVGIISEIGRQTYENVHTRGAENLVAAAKAAGVRRFVQMSALGVRANAVARYHKSKWAAEECVRASGLDWTIFRPSIIYGPGDGFVNLFARMSRWLPVLPVMGSGKNLMQPIAVEDVARCFVGALATPRGVEQGVGFALDAGPESKARMSLLSPHPDPLPKEREQPSPVFDCSTVFRPIPTQDIP